MAYLSNELSVIPLVQLNLPLRLDELIRESVPSPLEPPDPQLLRLVAGQEAEGKGQAQ